MFIAYSGLWITDEDPTGDAGLALQNNFKYIAEKLTSLNNSISSTATSIVDDDGSEEIDWSSNRLYILTLDKTHSPCTISFVDPTVENQGLTLILKQDGVGNALVTWPSGIYWAGPTAPILASGISQHTYCSFRLIDNIYYGNGFEYGEV
jgi:hypothetical protein